MRAVPFLDFYRSRDGRRVLLYQALALAAGAIALSVGLGDGRLDLTIARWFFDDARRIFPLTNQWLLKTVLHDAARTVSAVGALALLGLTVTSWVAPQVRAVRAHREVLLFTSIATLGAAAIVGALKHFSSHACPWDLAIFGGSAVYHPLLGAPVERRRASTAVSLRLIRSRGTRGSPSVSRFIPARAGEAGNRGPWRSDWARYSASCRSPAARIFYPTFCGRPGSFGP